MSRHARPGPRHTRPSPRHARPSRRHARPSRRPLPPRPGRSLRQRPPPPLPLLPLSRQRRPPPFPPSPRLLRHPRHLPCLLPPSLPPSRQCRPSTGHLRRRHRRPVPRSPRPVRRPGLPPARSGRLLVASAHRVRLGLLPGHPSASAANPSRRLPAVRRAPCQDARSRRRPARVAGALARLRPGVRGRAAASARVLRAVAAVPVVSAAVVEPEAGVTARGRAAASAAVPVVPAVVPVEVPVGLPAVAVGVREWDGAARTSGDRAAGAATSRSSSRRSSPRTRRPPHRCRTTRSSLSGGRRHATSVPS